MSVGLAIVGYGKMGRLIEQLAPEYGFDVRAKFDGRSNPRGQALSDQTLQGVDVAVEFTSPEAAPENIRRLAAMGVNLFMQAVAHTASLFAKHADYEAWGWEIHHSAKKDAPSGTLKKLAEEMRTNGFHRPVCLSSNRAGAHQGTHEIGFDSPADTITLRHTARSRDGFARGALRAARWINGKQGVFEFREILSELS